MKNEVIESIREHPSYRPLLPSRRATLNLIMMYVNDENESWVSQQTVVRVLGYAPNTVKDSFRDLAKAGFLRYLKTEDRGNKRYHVGIPTPSTIEEVPLQPLNPLPLQPLIWTPSTIDMESKNNKARTTKGIATDVARASLHEVRANVLESACKSCGEPMPRLINDVCGPCRFRGRLRGVG